MFRLSFYTTVFSLLAAPAFAHEGAGVVHYLTQADHVAGLIAAPALAGLFWLVLRGRQPEARKQPINQRGRKD